VAKIESIRPGGSLSASFAEYPLPDLLFGILRGNLSGRLDVQLHPEPRNRVYFRDGVPIAVDLADAYVSPIGLMMEAGEIDQTAGLDLLRDAESSGGSELTMLDHRQILPPGKLRELEARRARMQLVRLFDVGTVNFTFHEGLDRPEQVRLTILQPLPIVYEGLRTTKDRALIERVLEDHVSKSFILAPTYPVGVDPFEWGPEIDGEIMKLSTEPATLTELVERGLDRKNASAAFASLLLAGMLEEQERISKDMPAKPKSDPKNRPQTAPRKPVEEAAEKEPSGLVIHYKSGLKAKAPSKDVPASSPAAAPIAPPPAAGGQSEYDSVKARFTHFEGKTYYQILRVAPNTDQHQLERAYRFLVRRPDGGDSDEAGSRALKGLFHEAFECLSEPERAKRYRALVEWGDKSSNAVREREAVEAEPKVDRGFRALGEGHFGEARALLEWAKKLDPLRGDIPLLIELSRYLSEPGEADAIGIATGLVAERQRRPEDERVKLAYAFCLAEENEDTAARALINTLIDREHPMAKRVSSKLRS
jgi:hypothetical protein